MEQPENSGTAKTESEVPASAEVDTKMKRPQLSRKDSFVVQEDMKGHGQEGFNLPLPGLHTLHSRICLGRIWTNSPLSQRINTKHNNLDLDQVSKLRTQQLETETTNIKDADTVSNRQKLNSLKEELSKTNEERNYFQAQYKFQMQVNSELKSLLVVTKRLWNSLVNHH
ncbi:uncharacterized protein LOC113563738 [Drosophila erecta]|uniref:uncharacterized protein LOC113563738 n=1 Tax=Drosophila erecta TaxID=7220 RepID=UPI000F05F329|nr:uncharacterized protein LOC113563738 [Drosophila erecta]